jgi:hypothetical protein
MLTATGFNALNSVRRPTTTPVQNQRHIPATQTPAPLMNASVEFSGLKGWRKALAATLIGAATLVPAGCNSDLGTMDKNYQQIPVVQVENRLDFLSQQLKHESPKVRIKVFDYLGGIQVASGQKVPLILRGLEDKDQDVMLAAMKAGQTIVDNPDVNQTLRSALGDVLTSKPWREAYQVYSHDDTGLMMIPDGNGGFIYIPYSNPVYNTHYRDHGNAEQHQTAKDHLQEVLRK